MKKDDSANLALNAKPNNRQLLKNQHQMLNIDELIVTEEKVGEQYLTILNLKHAYSQFKRAADTARQCYLSLVGGGVTGTGFYGLADKPAELKKVMDITFNIAINTFSFLDDILIVSKGDKFEHEKLVKKVMKNLSDENMALKNSKGDFFLKLVRPPTTSFRS